MKKCICLECRKVFYIKPSKIGKYCSKKCYSKHLPKFRADEQRGNKNHCWKGNKVSKRTLHKFLRRNHPDTGSCSYCNRRTSYLDLANKSGEYTRNIKDYIYLCRSCHIKFDLKRGVRPPPIKKCAL